MLESKPLGADCPGRDALQCRTGPLRRLDCRKVRQHPFQLSIEVTRNVSLEVANLFAVEHGAGRLKSIVVRIREDLNCVIAIAGFFELLSQRFSSARLIASSRRRAWLLISLVIVSC